MDLQDLVNLQATTSTPTSTSASASTSWHCTYPREWTPLHTRSKASGGAGPPDGPRGGTGYTQEEEHQDLVVQEEHSPQEESIQVVVQAAVAHLQAQHPRSRQEEQEIQVAIRRPHLQAYPRRADISIHGHPWTDQEKPLAKLSLPSHYKSRSILDTQQMLEVWCDKSTFAIATWRGDAQQYWLTQVLDCARARHVINGFKVPDAKGNLDTS